MDRIKVTVSREDGTPICAIVPEPDTVFLTDASPLLIVQKDGGTVETISGGLPALLEFTARQLARMSGQKRRELCEIFGLS